MSTENPFFADTFFDGATKNFDVTVDDMNENFGQFGIDTPDYRRGGNVWTLAEQSGYVESVIAGLPMQPIYMCSENEIVDGLQRVTALIDYVGGKFILEGLSIILPLEGLECNDLPEVWRQQLLNAHLRVVVVDRRIAGETYRRLNRGRPIAN